MTTLRPFRVIDAWVRPMEPVARPGVPVHIEMESDMSVQGIYATISVSDLERSVDWYSKLMGSPPRDRPTDFLVQWRGGRVNLQLWKDDANAGHSVSTIVFTDLDSDYRRIAANGIDLGEIKQMGPVRIAKVSDPDGNVLTLTEGPDD